MMIATTSFGLAAGAAFRSDANSRTETTKCLRRNMRVQSSRIVLPRRWANILTVPLTGCRSFSFETGCTKFLDSASLFKLT